MDTATLAAELDIDVPEVGHKSFNHKEHKAQHQQDGNKKRNEGRKVAWKAGLVATELSAEEEEEKYAEFLKKEHTHAVASVKAEGTEIRVVSFVREGKVRIFFMRGQNMC
jgi:hypothetical protein